MEACIAIGFSGRNHDHKLIVTNPIGTPNTPEDKGWMPNHRPESGAKPKNCRKVTALITM